jgi:peptide/nickel transport system substrate-binding protein
MYHGRVAKFGPPRVLKLILALSFVASLTGCSRERLAGGIGNSTAPVRGGTFRVVGAEDVDHLATTSSVSTRAWWLFQAFTRELVSYRASADFKVVTQVAPDLVEMLPTEENGGISQDGLTYTFHLKRGVRWNTTPPRDIAADDVVRGFKLLCNPVNPSPGGNLYEVIRGLTSFCEMFARVPSAVGDVKRFIETHDIEGVRAPDDATVVFLLQQPASDFLNLLADTYATPAPVEYLNYLPDSPEFRQHTISNGPYQIVKYTSGREIVLERNPVWNANTDPLRPAYVDRIEIRLGLDEQLVQLQIEAGLADVSFDVRPPVAELASLLEVGNTNLLLAPPGNDSAFVNYLAINMVDPNTGALNNVQVRKALQAAIDKAAMVQNWGGAREARPMRQAAISGGAGYRPGGDWYVTPADTGDPVEARRLLAEAGYPNGISLKMAYPLFGTASLDAQSIQASLSRAGIDIQLVGLARNTYYALLDTETAKRGAWDLLYGSAVTPDWYGANNGRVSISAWFEGTGKGVYNVGRYNNDAVNMLINRALTAAKAADAEKAWAEASAHVMEDAAIVPLVEGKYAWLHSARVRNCVMDITLGQCSITSVWLDNR